MYYYYYNIRIIIFPDVSLLRRNGCGSSVCGYKSNRTRIGVGYVDGFEGGGGWRYIIGVRHKFNFDSGQ